jgi:pimeloyl-ACP methyl ester carboxylesterase
VTGSSTPRLEESSLLHPAGLALYEKKARGDAKGVVICVHGSLDRARSFARIARRLPDFDVIAYDRRGYEASQSVPAVADLQVQIDDLRSLVELVAERGPVSLFGHSMGGSIVISAAVADSTSLHALITYESPLRWLIEEDDWWTPSPTPAAEAEAFFRMMTAPGTWDRLSDAERTLRQGDGAALVADLRMSRGEIPFEAKDLARISVPLTLGLGGATPLTRFAQTAEVVMAWNPLAEVAIVPDALHGAHLRSPDALAQLVERAVARANLLRSES